MDTPQSSSARPLGQAGAEASAGASTLPPTFAVEIGSGRVRWGSVALFVVLTFGLTWAIWGVGIALGLKVSIYALVGMFVPALMATLVRLVRREGFADAGLGLAGQGVRRGWRYYVAAYLGVPMVIFAGIGLVLLIGYQHWNLAANMNALAHQIATTPGAHLPSGMTAQQFAPLLVVIEFVAAFSFALPINMIATFGEEFGWRGFLLVRLAPLGGVRAAVLTGIIWGLWHAPLIVLVGYNYPGHPVLGVLVMVVFTVCLGVFFAWLRFRSGSVWPSVLGHAAYNAQAGFGALLLTSGNSLLRAPIGLLGLVPIALLAVYLIASGRLALAR